ncbi:hypothetical protein SEPCBS119000_000945 [Sporothrix epigloea]|uniref:Armadillo-like helical domain-containing protein n=1 Tax=Sporothrix epigloea TaxID=1892477 RepID=A0ABP0D7Z9_9PEZI
MEQSPLTHQPRPEVFQPKIVQLYDELLDHPDHLPSDGFWAEFFLLRPDRRAFRERLDALTAGDLLALEAQTRQLFVRAVGVLSAGSGSPATTSTASANGHRPNGSALASTGRSGSRSHIASNRTPTAVGSQHSSSLPLAAPSFSSPSSPAAVENTLATLTTFLSAVLSKKYNNPSSDVIDLLAGLDRVDAVVSDFVAALDQLLRYGKTPTIRQLAVQVALAVTAAAYQTTLLTYFIQRDLFPAIIKVISDTPTSSSVPSFTLVGLLANYNKFEFQNPYQLRLNDFVNEQAIHTIIWGVGDACAKLRAQYIDIQDDLPEGWTLTNTLGKIGLGGGSKTPPKPIYDAETAKALFTALPGDDAAVLLATYDFTHANKLFCFSLVTLGTRPVTTAATTDKDGEPLSSQRPTTPHNSTEPPIASFISLTSYLLQHAHRSARATNYVHLSLMVFRLLIEDPALCRRLCLSDENARVAVRLCRQRAPHLPLIKSPRPLASCILDIMVDGLTHNLRRRLDVGLYTLLLGILLRLVAHLSRTHTRLTYAHWPDLFRALLSLVRFLNTYAADLRGAAPSTSSPQLQSLVDHVVNLLALGLSAGESFLPTPAAYDDLFYKVVESGDVLTKFRDTYQLNTHTGSSGRSTNSIDTLLSVNAHYKQLLAEGVKGGKGSRVKGLLSTSSSSTLTSLQVAEVIKQGYETLSIQASAGLDGWEKYREADERTLLKRVARTAVADVKHKIEADV